MGSGANHRDKSSWISRQTLSGLVIRDFVLTTVTDLLVRSWRQACLPRARDRLTCDLVRAARTIRWQLTGPASKPNKKAYPNDEIIQDCLRGRLEPCAQCAYSLVTSQRLLMQHVGFNTSTTARTYSSNSWQCDWRHPFNGEADTIVF